MADRNYSAALAAALQQQFEDQFKAPTSEEAVNQMLAKYNEGPQLAGLTEAQLRQAFGDSASVAGIQQQAQASAYAPVLATNKALESYGNNGIYASQANQDLANTALGAYTNEQLEQLINQSNVAQGIQQGGTYTNPDDQRSLMRFNDLSMLNPMNNNTSVLSNASNALNTTQTQSIAPNLTTSSVIDNLSNIGESATIEALTTARNQALNALDQEQSTIEPQYADARSQTRALSSRSGQSFQQMLANKGINISGQSALGETMRTGALQGEIGALNQAELAALGDIASRRTDVNIGYTGDVAQSRAQALENQIAQDKNDYLSTIGRFSNNYQEEINNVANDGDPTNDWQLAFLEAARQDKINQLGLDQSGNPIVQTTGMVSQEAQDALNAYNAGFRTQAVIDILTNAGYQFPATGTSNVAGTTTTPTTGYTTDQYNQYRVSRDSILRAYANDPQGMVDHVLGRASTLTDVLGPDLYNQLVSDVQATVTAEPVVAPTYEPTFNLDDYYDTIKAMQDEIVYGPNLTGQAQGIPKYSDGEIKAYINNLNLGLEETAELFNRLGIPN